MFTITMHKHHSPPYVRKIAGRDQAIAAAEVLTRVGDGDTIRVHDSEGKIISQFIRDPRSGMWQKGF